MDALTNPGFIIINLSLLFLIFVFIYVVRMRSKSQIHYAFLVLMVTTFIWGSGSVKLYFDYLTGNSISFPAVCVAYIGLILTPVAALYIGLIFAKTSIRFNWKYGLSIIIPIISIMILLTNNQHNLFYRYLSYEELTQFAALGPYFIIHTFYSYICLLVGMFYLLYFSVKNAGFFSKQSVFILLGIVCSFGYNALLTFQVIKGLFHTNVIMFFFTFLFFYLAIIKFDLLSIVPIALQNIVDHISDSFLVVDKKQSVIDFNKTFRDTFTPIMKINRRETLDQLIDRAANYPDFRELLISFRDAVISGELTRYERSFTIQDEKKSFAIEVTPLTNSRTYISTVILIKDVTEVRNAMETIQRNYEILTENERLASLGQLIGGIAHNLKTPIMSISGGIEAMLDLIDEYEQSISDPTVNANDHREIAAEMKAWTEKIRPHCRYMSDIISTVKGQAAQFSTDTVMTFMLDELIKRVELLMKHELNRYHCSLRIRDHTDQLVEIQGDVSSLVQIFDNLIINAIHAYEGKKGEIELDIEIDNNRVIFALRDKGKGIPEAVQDRLFKEMVTTKGKEGTGLGLYMSHATIRGRFNGSLRFESQAGVGTTFYIAIPVLRTFTRKASRDAPL